MKELFVKDRKLGVAEGRRYDLPLNKSAGSGFLILLVALMTFLGALALSSLFALGDMTARWSSGLENQMTIEIPAQKDDGTLRGANDIQDLEIAVKKKLDGRPAIASLEILDSTAIQKLVSPWLGSDATLDDMPLPGLIAVTLNDPPPAFFDTLDNDLKTIDPTIRIDRHEEWLNDLLGLIGSFRFLAFIVMLIIAVTGITAVAGAIRSRMAEHKPDVELLHLMGASDLYITRQFQRHAFILGLQGGLAGLALGGGLFLGFTLFSSGTAQGLLPDFSLSGFHIFVVLCLPLFACLICAGTARITVLRALRNMP
ncbi:MAG: cell division protein FtsX [Bdellovibrionales bacterium]